MFVGANEFCKLCKCWNMFIVLMPAFNLLKSQCVRVHAHIQQSPTGAHRVHRGQGHVGRLSGRGVAG